MENKLENNNEPGEHGRKQREKPNRLKSGWAIKVLFITLILSFSLSVLSELLLSSTHSTAGTFISILILVLFIAVAIFCDMLGVAIASADIVPFLSMASKREAGAKESIRLIKNADRSSSLLNDIVGDACGIICGSIGAGIVSSIAIHGEIWQVILASAISALIAAVTVSGKAICKTIAIERSNAIVAKVGKFIYVLKGKKRNS